MVEILDVGSEAETCLMAGKGMNGLRGNIVCFNTSNQRYTLELESGEMMSLRQRNVRAVKPKKEKVAKEQESSVTGVASARSQQTEREKVFVETVDSDSESESTSNPAFRPGSSLPRAPVAQEQQEDNKREQGRTPAAVSWFDELLISVFGGVVDFCSNLTPTMILVVVLAVGWMAYNSDYGSSWRGHRGYGYYDLNGSYFYDAWSLPSTYAIISIGTLAFIVWKFGTGNGQRNWDADRFWQRLQQMSFWEVLQFGWLIERVLNALHQGGGGGRQRHHRF